MNEKSDVFYMGRDNMANSFGRLEEIKKIESMQGKAEYAKNAGLKINGKSLLLIIDMQNDFMEGGALPVKGALADARRLSEWIMQNAAAFKGIVATMDTHGMNHIFFPGWWEDAAGKTVKPFTPIRSEDLQELKYLPRFFPKKSRDYVEGLEQLGKYSLMIWPYHCIANTSGHLLEQNVMNALVYYEAAGGKVTRVYKGLDPLSEMYGIYQCEYPEEKNMNKALLKMTSGYEKIFIAGEAKSHCVLRTIEQLCAYMEKKEKPLSAIHILSDCMSVISGFEATTQSEFEALQNRGVVITDTVHAKL